MSVCCNPAEVYRRSVGGTGICRGRITNLLTYFESFLLKGTLVLLPCKLKNSTQHDAATHTDTQTSVWAASDNFPCPDSSPAKTFNLNPAKLPPPPPCTTTITPIVASLHRGRALRSWRPGTRRAGSPIFLASGCCCVVVPCKAQVSCDHLPVTRCRAQKKYRGSKRDLVAGAGDPGRGPGRR